MNGGFEYCKSAEEKRSSALSLTPSFISRLTSSYHQCIPDLDLLSRRLSIKAGTTVWGSLTWYRESISEQL